MVKHYIFIYFQRFGNSMKCCCKILNVKYIFTLHLKNKNTKFPKFTFPLPLAKHFWSFKKLNSLKFLRLTAKQQKIAELIKNRTNGKLSKISVAQHFELLQISKLSCWSVSTEQAGSKLTGFTNILWAGELPGR